jgi:hypothetical protein
VDCWKRRECELMILFYTLRPSIRLLHALKRKRGWELRLSREQQGILADNFRCKPLIYIVYYAFSF